MKIVDSVLDLIGNTPMVELSRLAAHYGVEGRILAKLENLNPTGSKKDRIALRMIEDAERAGRLSPGQTVIEETSGNTGNALAMVCAVKGYPFVAAMSTGNSVERMKMMRGLGAELLLTEQLPQSIPGQVTGEDLAEVSKAAWAYAEQNGAFMSNQFHNLSNNQAHCDTTAREILDQTDGQLDYFVDFIGTGGTFAGTAMGLKAHSADIKCFVVEPANAGYYAQTPPAPGGHVIQGGGYNRELDLVDRALVDGAITISDDEAIDATRVLASVEGIFAGASSGANAMAAVKLLRGEGAGKTVVLLLPDTGLKYLSTDLYT